MARACLSAIFLGPRLGHQRSGLGFLCSDGSAQRAYPNNPWVDKEGTTVRCQLGSWSLNDDVLELRFEATKDDPAIDERRKLSYFHDFVRLTREGENRLDFEDWLDSQSAATMTTLDAWCPPLFGRGR